MKKPIIDVKSYNFYKRPSVFCALCCAYLCTAFLIFAGYSVHSAGTKALEYKDLVGSYKVVIDELSGSDDSGAITLTEDGDIFLEEEGKIQCRGKGELQGRVLLFEIPEIPLNSNCNSGTFFIDLRGVTQFDKFEGKFFVAVGDAKMTFERKIVPPLEPSKKAEDEGTQLPQFKDLVGSYKVTSSLMPGVENFVTLAENGSVTLKEVHPEGSINCDGKATIVGQVLISNMSCKHIAFANEEITYTQKIDLSTIKPLGADKLEDADMFEAIVFTSLLEMEIPMVFERVGVKK